MRMDEVNIAPDSEFIDHGYSQNVRGELQGK